MNYTLMLFNRSLTSSSRLILPIFGALVLILASFSGRSVLAADEPGLVTKTKDAVKETTETVEQAGRSAVDEAQQLWQRIDAARLKNRTPDEILAWVIMGALVGGLAGLLSSLKLSGAGKLGRLFLGLAGAFLGGMVVRVTGLDFGWGPVLIRYEELFVSFLGAILLIVVVRVIPFGFKGKSSKR